MLYDDDKLEQALTGIDFSHYSRVKESLLTDLLAKRRATHKGTRNHRAPVSFGWGAFGSLGSKRLTDDELDYAVAAGSGMMPPVRKAPV